MNGWLVLDKPTGVTSAKALAQVKKILRAPKAGHSGTLDPLASGVLPLALGNATKTIPWIIHSDKIYEFTITWGIQTDSDDSLGSPLQHSEKRPNENDIRKLLPEFTGDIMQTPPAFSALKQNGVRNYERARKGEIVTTAPRPVTIHEFALLAAPDENKADFRVRCGGGTYVRALARDLGQRLGCLGHISRLRRLRAGPFADPLTLAQIQSLPAEKILLPVGAALAHLPSVQVSEEDARRLARGQSIPALSENGANFSDSDTQTPADTAAFCDSRLVAVVVRDDGVFRPRRVFV